MTSLDDPFFRILCVDDNPMLLQALVFGLAQYGFEVVTASHGIDALMQFQAHAGNFRAVLTDGDMPTRNGGGLVRHLRALGYRGKIFVMSRRLSISGKRAHQDDAVSGFLHKPFEISMVATMLMQDS